MNALEELSLVPGRCFSYLDYLVGRRVRKDVARLGIAAQRGERFPTHTGNLAAAVRTVASDNGVLARGGDDLTRPENLPTHIGALSRNSCFALPGGGVRSRAVAV